MATKLTPDQRRRIRDAVLRLAPGAVLVLVTVVVAGRVVTTPADGYLPLDGRPVSSLAAPDVTSLENQEWMRAVERWVDDRVPGRDELLELNAAAVSRAFRSPVVNGVYVDPTTGMGLRESGEYGGDVGDLGARAEALAASTGGAPIVWVDVPAREEVFADRLPEGWGLDFESRAEDVRAALAPHGTYADLRPILTDDARREEFFMRADHHWSADGAREAMVPILAALADSGLDLRALEPEYERIVYPGPAMGSVGREATLGSRLEPDVFAAYVPVGGYSVRECEQDMCNLDAFRVSSANDAARPYASRYMAFIGSNRGIVHLHNDTTPSDVTLVVVKDSFANPLSLMLGEVARDVWVVDERYLEDSTVAELVRSVGADAVIVVHATSAYAGGVVDDSWVP